MMRLRRFELIFVGITLAFLFFMGGFFTGRNFNRVSIDSFDTFRVETSAGSDAATANATDNAQLQANDTGNLLPVGGAGADGSGLEESPVDGNVAANPAVNANQENVAPTDVEPGMPRGGDGRININTASRNELMDLPGIGPSLADSIVEYRNANGGFGSVEEIMNVSGIAEGRFARIKDRITVES